MLAKAHFAIFFLHPTAHLLDAKVIIATQKWLLQRKSGYCNAKVVIAMRKLLLQRESCYCNAKVVIETRVSVQVTLQLFCE